MTKVPLVARLTGCAETVAPAVLNGTSDEVPKPNVGKGFVNTAALAPAAADPEIRNVIPSGTPVNVALGVPPATVNTVVPPMVMRKPCEGGVPEVVMAKPSQTRSVLPATR